MTNNLVKYARYYSHASIKQWELSFIKGAYIIQWGKRDGELNRKKMAFFVVTMTAFLLWPQ